MTQQQRLNRVLELVSERGSVSIAEIGDALGVSTATVRRDLNTLAEQRLVTRTHGGATALGSGYELPLQYKTARQAEAKVAIARAVAGLVQPGDSVGLNGGTTTSEVARELGRSERLRSRGDAPGVTIVTNALNIAYELSVREHVKIVVTGGVPRRQSYELVGPLVGAALREFSIDTAVLGVDGLSAGFGATTMHEGEAEASREIAAVARRVVIAADATKLGRSTFARICPLSRIDVLVTDQPVSAELAAELAGSSVEIVVAPRS
ncbi:DeoR/GlpR family DNA-binding transcription regulator [Microbacterium betulae]|uniref:DeoR/GlpR family DNA-binding transcription regulator n=1 Tax=Microbacterium betulae TaxID=2981139 RepID=A0AA97FHK9_9MICO|nr:DeoR/GlpR family DNA-binding transcription regulator [Microbacterium sp. AB]WOF23155.1 DeoR/GlpR family DNA-binding transcription regulator [Microbacterium sp. AB]